MTTDTPLFPRAAAAIARIRARLGEIVAGSDIAATQAELDAARADRRRIVEAIEDLADDFAAPQQPREQSPEQPVEQPQQLAPADTSIA